LAGRAAWLRNYRFGLRVGEQGTVVSVGDGIAWIEGLPSAAMDEILDLEDGSRAMVFQLETHVVGAILLEQTSRLTAGTIAHLSGQRMGIPTGDALIGRVVDPLGNPLDGLNRPECLSSGPLDILSPPITARDFVHKPLYTGSKIVDTLIPIGKGQRQLIIGDNGLGKSSLAIDAVINQRGRGVRCVYVMVGQKRSSVVDTIEILRQYGALDHTALVVAEATSLPGLKFLAPFAGCAVAEHWMWQGKDTLVIYDDLTTHAEAYRELSLLLRRPPGREAYPGDIFFLHSRLLERSTCLAPAHGGGSMTALPIVETKEGEIAA
jgi:F-type H+-transporting ATPase subunit alpha